MNIVELNKKLYFYLNDNSKDYVKEHLKKHLTNFEWNYFLYHIYPLIGNSLDELSLYLMCEIPESYDLLEFLNKNNLLD